MRRNNSGHPSPSPPPPSSVSLIYPAHSMRRIYWPLLNISLLCPLSTTLLSCAKRKTARTKPRHHTNTQWSTGRRNAICKAEERRRRSWSTSNIHTLLLPKNAHPSPSIYIHLLARPAQIRGGYRYDFGKSHRGEIESESTS